MPHPSNLERFIDAQSDTFETALSELRSGRKQSHWMWFIFPQLAGLGRSPTARYFGIASIAEARDYLADPLLGPRLRSVSEALLRWAGDRSADDILGPVDAMKLRSSMTLFEAASDDPLFSQLLDSFYSGARDERTLALLNGEA
ncbi:MAG TPA: DUF1810 domain-containing protein [Sphingomicrobium sp.]|nr:DUF1810 domain-containing protein [Sphingomicrobium sp.]